ncbi:MAG TPA: helicase-related protein, partial [Spongiibacteraceae bacterium]|nr:helicase-related protein [Spongiibacteraceae bacterium]
VLVFTRTKHGANKLSQQLERDGITSAAIHGNKSQGARTRALADFKAGEVRVLVGTDIAARGLDIEQLPHVVNYELPNVPEDYVHRIGRTGRAGASGEAISLVSPEERKLQLDIEKLIKRKLDVQPLGDFPRRSPKPPQSEAPQRESANSHAPRKSQPNRTRSHSDERRRTDRGDRQHANSAERSSSASKNAERSGGAPKPGASQPAKSSAPRRSPRSTNSPR